MKNVVIGKQFQKSENLQKFNEIVKDKNIKVIIVKDGDKISIEKNLYFDVLWPDSNQVIYENSINNNSLVCKLNFGNFSVLFTGDIEEEPEKRMAKKYKNNSTLKSTILKVAHHGSKSSSTEEFLKSVNPKIALIGVGKNNLYGHPENQTLERLEKLRCRYL